MDKTINQLAIASHFLTRSKCDENLHDSTSNALVDITWQITTTNCYYGDFQDNSLYVLQVQITSKFFEDMEICDWLIQLQLCSASFLAKSVSVQLRNCLNSSKSIATVHCAVPYTMSLDAPIKAEVILTYSSQHKFCSSEPYSQSLSMVISKLSISYLSFFTDKTQPQSVHPANLSEEEMLRQLAESRSCDESGSCDEWHRTMLKSSEEIHQAEWTVPVTDSLRDKLSDCATGTV